MRKYIAVGAMAFFLFFGLVANHVQNSTLQSNQTRLAAIRNAQVQQLQASVCSLGKALGAKVDGC